MMESYEFVKENPWLLDDNLFDLKQIVNESNGMKFFCINNTLGHSYDNHGGGLAIPVDDLKRIIDSHEIITLFKSIDQAKIEVEACEKANHLELLVKLDEGVGYIYVSRVKQSIVDVDGCLCQLKDM